MFFCVFNAEAENTRRRFTDIYDIDAKNKKTCIMPRCNNKIYKSKIPLNFFCRKCSRGMPGTLYAAKNNPRATAVIAIATVVIFAIALCFRYPLVGIVVVCLIIFILKKIKFFKKAVSFFNEIKNRLKNIFCPDSPKDYPTCNDFHSSQTSTNHHSVKDKYTGNDWYQEGLLFCYGHQGHPVDYEKAEECFKKAIAAGEEKGQSGLEYLKYLR